MPALMKRLDGRPVLVTGAASGVGRATCHRLAEEGALVAALDVDQRVNDLPKELDTTSIAFVCDVSVEEDVSAAVERAATELGGLRGVATCAAIFDPEDFRPAGELSLSTLRHTIDVNLFGTVHAVKHAMPHLSVEGGSVVMIASIAALQGVGYGSGYTAAKGAILALTRLWAVQYGSHNVRVNCICPGGIDTPMMGGFLDNPHVVEAIRKTTPLQRVAQPEEIAATIAYLLSDDASIITGSTVVADGGTTIA
jgi:NAD(P)-dependent dehydrogenase (short-subunit alcohol dehydrogenase family)